MIIKSCINFIETSLNRYIHLDPETVSGCVALEHKVVCVDELISQTTFYFIFTKEGIRLQTYSPGKVDATIQGSFFSLAKLAINARSQNVAMYTKDVIISGDIELGQEVNRLLSSIHIDWEEQLSKVTGDVVAHQIGSMVRGLKSLGKKTLASLGQDITEYLQEEAKHLPPRLEVNDFTRELEEIRDGVERMEAKIERYISKEQT